MFSAQEARKITDSVTAPIDMSVKIKTKAIEQSIKRRAYLGHSSCIISFSIYELKSFIDEVIKNFAEQGFRIKKLHNSTTRIKYILFW